MQQLVIMTADLLQKGEIARAHCEFGRRLYRHGAGGLGYLYPAAIDSERRLLSQ